MLLAKMANPLIKGKDEQKEPENAFEEKEKKLDDQAKKDDGFRKEGEKAGGQVDPPVNNNKR